MALTFKTAFKNEFFEALKPLGFQKVKQSNHPYLARVINGEIVEAVSFRGAYKPPRGYEVHIVEIGIASVYTDVMDMSTKAGSSGWFRDMDEYYGATLKPNGFERLRPQGSIPAIEFPKGDEQAMLTSVRECAALAAGIIEPALGSVKDIDSYFDWLVEHHMARLYIDIQNDLAASRLGGHYANNECLLWLMTSQPRDAEKEFMRSIKREMLMYEKRGDPRTEEQVFDHSLKQALPVLCQMQRRLMTEPELREAALKKAGERREQNLALLRRQGFDV